MFTWHDNHLHRWKEEILSKSILTQTERSSIFLRMSRERCAFLSVVSEGQRRCPRWENSLSSRWQVYERSTKGPSHPSLHLHIDETNMLRRLLVSISLDCHPKDIAHNIGDSLLPTRQRWTRRTSQLDLNWPIPVPLGDYWSIVEMMMKWKDFDRIRRLMAWSRTWSRDWKIVAETESRRCSSMFRP